MSIGGRKAGGGSEGGERPVRSSRWWYLAFGAAVVLIVVYLLSSDDRFQWVPGGPIAAPVSVPPYPIPVVPAPPPTAFLYVDPTGSDDNDGSSGAPLRTIQAGLTKATPGTQITLAPGVYREQLTTVRDGTADAPITIKGPESGKDRAGRYQATVYGTGRVISIDHSHYVLDGFTVDGQEQLAATPFPADLATIDAFKDSVQDTVADSRLIYVGSAEDSSDLTGITINNMFLSGAGGECVRLRNNAHDNSITDSVIQYCGMYGRDVLLCRSQTATSDWNGFLLGAERCQTRDRSGRLQICNKPFGCDHRGATGTAHCQHC